MREREGPASGDLPVERVSDGRDLLATHGVGGCEGAAGAPVADAPPGGFDTDVVVSFRHRVRFTRALFADAPDPEDVRGLLDVLTSGEAGQGSARVFVVIDRGVCDADPRLSARLAGLLGRQKGRADVVAPPHILAGGEACKNDPAVVDDLLRRFNDAHLDRRAYVLVVGGGAVLDVVGYAAAIAHRGLRLVRVPSTTLAQCDSGVGVKNAVNRFGKKNWQGTFAVPWAVVNDEGLLTTLGDAEYRGGFSEAVKVALLKSPAFFDDLCRSACRLASRDAEVARDTLRRSAAMHLRHIAIGGDAFEMREARPLDFGHWSAHRLEALSHFRLSHGHAVAIGLAIDTTYAHLAHGLPADDLRRTLRCLHDLHLSTRHPLLSDPDAILHGLEEFRQHLGGRLTITLPARVGHPIDVHEIDPRLMREAIRRAGEAGRQVPLDRG